MGAYALPGPPDARVVDVAERARAGGLGEPGGGFGEARVPQLGPLGGVGRPFGAVRLRVAGAAAAAAGDDGPAAARPTTAMTAAVSAT